MFRLVFASDGIAYIDPFHTFSRVTFDVGVPGLPWQVVQDAAIDIIWSNVIHDENTEKLLKTEQNDRIRYRSSVFVYSLGQQRTS